MTGNLLSVLLGPEAIPERWLAELELRADIEQLARDLHTRYQPDAHCAARYPGC